MPYTEIQPSPGRQETIKSFWSASRVFTSDQPHFEILPDGYAELVFSHGSDCYITAIGHTVKLPNPFIIGLLDAPLYFHADSSILVFGVRLYPWALGSVAEAYISGEFGNWLPGLQASICNDSTTDTLQLLKQLFETRFPDSMESALKKAANLLLSRKGKVTTADLAQHANISLRVFQRIFRHNCGETAKSVSRRMRFEQARDRIWDDPDSHLTRLAYDLGFADQAHLNREFRHFARKTPGQFAREARISKSFLEQNSVVYLQVRGR